VQSEDEFISLYPLASKAGNGLVLVEECLKNKRELECAFIEINGERIVTPPGEVMINGFYGYGEKYGGITRTEPRAQLPNDVADTIVEYGNLLADSVMLRHLGRIDFFLSDGEIYFNEINTFPGFTHESLYPRMLEAYGLPPREALLSFIRDIC
jgi:D-alanine-D-alanine ligase